MGLSALLCGVNKTGSSDVDILVEFEENADLFD